MIAVIRSGDVVTVTEEQSTASVMEASGAVTVTQAATSSVTVTQPSSTITVVQGSGGGSGIPYTGAYEVTPSTSVQTLATNGLVMTGDVTVFEVPYFETSNVSGITVYIASEV